MGITSPLFQTLGLDLLLRVVFGHLFRAVSCLRVHQIQYPSFIAQPLPILCYKARCTFQDAPVKPVWLNTVKLLTPCSFNAQESQLTSEIAIVCRGMKAASGDHNLLRCAPVNIAVVAFVVDLPAVAFVCVCGYYLDPLDTSSSPSHEEHWPVVLYDCWLLHQLQILSRSPPFSSVNSL